MPASPAKPSTNPPTVSLVARNVNDKIVDRQDHKPDITHRHTSADINTRLHNPTTSTRRTATRNQTQTKNYRT